MAVVRRIVHGLTDDELERLCARTADLTATSRYWRPS